MVASSEFEANSSVAQRARVEHLTANRLCFALQAAGSCSHSCAPRLRGLGASLLLSLLPTCPRQTPPSKLACALLSAPAHVLRSEAVTDALSKAGRQDVHRVVRAAVAVDLPQLHEACAGLKPGAAMKTLILAILVRISLMVRR